MLGDSGVQSISNSDRSPVLPRSPHSPPSSDPNPKHSSGDEPQPSSSSRRTARKPGRPATYVFNKPDEQLTEKERKMKVSIEKRRLRQNRSYHRRKKVRKLQSTSSPTIPVPSDATVALQQALATAAATAAANAAGSATADPSPASSVPNASWRVPSLPKLDTPDSFAAAAEAVAAAAPSNSSLSPPAAPKFIPGFAQNPLDLLASATASGQSASAVGSTSSQQLPSSAHMDPNFPLSVTPNPLDLTIATNPMPIPPDVPPASVAQDSTPLINPVHSVDATLEIDATSAPMDCMSSLSLGFDVSKVVPEEELDPTEELVKSAMVAAKEYARDSMNLKDAVDRETELRRMTGIKTIVFDNLRSKYLSMPEDMKNSLRHFVIFPRTFNLKAAAAVAGLCNTDDVQLVSMQGMLNSMIDTNFIMTNKGRYELNEAARLFLNEDSTVLNDNIASGGETYHVAQNRFLSHFRKQLVHLQDDNIHKIGWLREHAMALYDSERENMEFSEYLLNGRNSELRQFLSAGITVMRYCVSASNRERMLRKALYEDETSTEDIFLSLEASNKMTGEASTSSETGKNKDAENADRARLHLALSEAYFDQLKLSEAEEPLKEALKLMGVRRPKSGMSSAKVVDSVLVLLLLSNLKLTADDVKEARLLCVNALQILAEADLGRSTFGINALSNLVKIYLMEGYLEKAKSVASRLLDTLNDMRYTGMPIYADALGVCAMVSMSEGKFKDAEKQYERALETVGKWGSKEWTGIPVQHCLDLDLWLMEGLAEAIRRQGKVQEAFVMEQRAAEDRENRGLPRHLSVSPMSFLEKSEESCRPLRPLSFRHLY